VKRKFWLILMFLSITLAACSSGTTQQASPASPVDVTGEKVAVAGGSYTDVSVNQLQSMLAQKDFVFVNVHIPYEGDIANTDLSIPYDVIDQHLEQLPAKKDAKIVLYCRSGRMSSIAAETLVGLGYTNVWNLKGGMVAWEQAGLPIEGK
jgi:rhodanese-related sulfurtransferase